MSDRSKRILNLALSQHVDDNESYESEDSDDSLIDKNYNPPTDDSDSQVVEEEEDEEEQQAQRVDEISATGWSSVKQRVDEISATGWSSVKTSDPLLLLSVPKMIRKTFHQKYRHHYSFSS
ncbi:hypothetical protein QE152_g5202 [Popillia japonica]|uniref:Uncharacterized protein n=1 Tax=Popillia japonica TaxID=7064 RepID=A0AAW1MXU7_POPJA